MKYEIIKPLLKFAVFIAILAAILFLLWNWLMPTIFKLPAITYFQSVGLVILSDILFKVKTPGSLME